MFYVYLIKIRSTGELYFGSTNDLRKRILEHSLEHSKDKGSVKLIYYEAYTSEKDARRREHNLKYFGKAYGQLKRRIDESLRAS